MEIQQEFGNALAREWARDGDAPELLPVQLTRAAAAALGVDGVGLSVHDTAGHSTCLLYTSPSPRDGLLSRMPSSA